MSRNQIHVLHVDDEPEFADLTGTFLEREDDRFTVETATSADKGLEKVTDCPPDCVVSDYNMPGVDGLEFLQAIREKYPDLPFMLYTGKGSEEIASDAISAGVTDYLQKESGTGQYTVLANRIRNAVDNYYTQTELADREKRLNLFFEQSPLGVIEWDEHFDFVRMNEAAEDILGYAQNDLAGHSWEKIVPESDRDAVADVVSDLLENKAGYHSVNENVRKDGDRIVCEWHNRVVTDEGGDVVAIFSQFQDITERKQRERRFQTLVEESNDIISVVDADGVYQYQSPSLERILGHDPEETIGEKVWEYIHPEDRERAIDEFETRVTNPDRRVQDIQYRARHADGTWHWMEANGSDQLTNPAVGGYVITSRDITDRKERQQELEQTRALMANMEELSDAGAWEYNPETERLMITDGTRRLYGLDSDATLTLEAALDAVHPDDRDPLADRLNTCLETGRSYQTEVRLTPPDGEQRWIIARGERVEHHESGNVIRGYIQDITEERRQRMQLEETAARLEGLFDRSPDMIDVHDSEGNILDVNQQLAERTGYAKSELMEMKVWDLDARITPDEARTLWRDMDPDDRRQLEGVYQCRDGSTFPVEVHIRRLDIEDNDLFVVISRDITEQTERERELSTQNERLDEFASIVSHDLRSPLTVAEGHLELAQETCESEDLAKAAAAIGRSQALIDDLLTVAREGNQATDVESVALADVAESCWQTTETKSATLDVDTTQVIRADRSRLQQLFENLYRNAVEHGGEDVAVSVGAVDGGFYVADTGPGIPRSDCEEVFETGYSTTEGGTGFGLRIVEQIVEAHGWQISVTESAQGGAQFEVTGVETGE